MCWSRLGECARAIQCKRHNSRLETVENREDMESVTYWGTLLEPMVATAYTQKTGIRARKPNVVLQHPTFPYPRNRWSLRRADSGVQTAGEFGKRS